MFRDRHSIRVYQGIAASLLLLGLAGCGQAETSAPPAAQATVAVAPTEAPVEPAESAPAEAESELVRVEAVDGPPFYARFGENETFSDGETVAVVFYRSPDCIPDEFNLNAFFDFPSESGPGAFGCAPPTTDVVEYWAGEPGSGPAPAISEMTGKGAVPVWFFAAEDIESALADGVVTISDLEGIPSRRVGTAATYTELLHPSQSNAQSLIQFNAAGTLEDGGDFLVDASYGAPDVADHTTIEIE